MKKKNKKIGIIGGSGFYNLATGLKEIKIDTPYGSPSDKLALGKIADHDIVFLARHSKNHNIPPHKINYRANIWALKQMGVNQIITSHAVGSLQKKIKPGDFVILDQFIDRTRNRLDTFYDGPEVTHISTAYSYCPILRKLAFKTAKSLKIPIHQKGTVVVIQGPRFSTAAESWWFTKMGWDVANMTEYPEVALAKEMEMCYLAIAISTDYDVGLVSQEKIKPVSVKEIVRMFNANTKKAKQLILTMIKNWPKKIACQCQESLKEARL